MSRPLHFRTTLVGMLLLVVAAFPLDAQSKFKFTEKKKPKIDKVQQKFDIAEKELSAGNTPQARKLFEEAFAMDTHHRNDGVNIGLAKLLLTERMAAGEAYDLPEADLEQNFNEVPYLAQGFCQYHLGDKEGAKRAWHNIIEWRGSDQLARVLNELNLTDEVMQLHDELGIDTGTGIGAQVSLEQKYKEEKKWEGAFQLARERLVEIPVGSKAEMGAAFQELTKTCVGYFFKQADPNAALRQIAGELYQKTEDHKRVLRQILETGQAGKTTLAKVHSSSEAEDILARRFGALDEISGYLDTLAGHPETPVEAEAVDEPPEASPQQP